MSKSKSHKKGRPARSKHVDLRDLDLALDDEPTGRIAFGVPTLVSPSPTRAAGAPVALATLGDFFHRSK
jgi:hypothetical protein